MPCWISVEAVNIYPMVPIHSSSLTHPPTITCNIQNTHCSPSLRPPHPPPTKPLTRDVTNQHTKKLPVTMNIFRVWLGEEQCVTSAVTVLRPRYWNNFDCESQGDVIQIDTFHGEIPKAHRTVRQSVSSLGRGRFLLLFMLLRTTVGRCLMFLWVGG